MDKNLVYLAQSDTTAGLLSGDKKRLNLLKGRALNKPILITVDSFKKLKNLTRIPNNFKKIVRNSKKSTFIYPNKTAIRVVKDDTHASFLQKFDYLYSTSANSSGRNFDKDFAIEVADVIIEDKYGFFEGKSSKIFKININKIKRIR